MPKKTTATTPKPSVEKAPRKAVKTKSTASKKGLDELSAAVYDIAGKEIETISLSKDLFAVPVSDALLAQYVRVYLANQKQGTTNTKTRGEVVGSTRKIYRQKGTGGARHGSRKAPIFVGGGVAFGPRAHVRRLKLNKKQIKQALRQAFSLRFANNDIRFVKGVTSVLPKTKAFAKILTDLDMKSLKSLLFIYPKEGSGAMVLAARNIEKVTLKEVSIINAYDVLRSQKIIFLTEGVETLTSRLKT